MTSRFVLALAGDVMLGRLMNEYLTHGGPTRPWEDVLPLLEGADAFLFNLECAICRDLPQWRPGWKTFHFRMDPAHLSTLVVSGVDAVGLANNHVLDYGVDGLLETLDHLDGLGIPHAGAGRTLEEARAPATVERSGRKVGLVCAADHLEEWAAGPDTPGIFLIDPARRSDVDVLAEAFAAARQAGADTVIAGLHWGPNMNRTPSATFERFAERLVDSGADVVWGTSAHVPQGIAFRGRSVILFDTGDFLDDYAIDPTLRNDLSFLFRVNLGGAAVDSVDLLPVRIEHGRTLRAAPAEHEWLRDVEETMSSPFGTRIEVRGAGLIATRG